MTALPDGSYASSQDGTPRRQGSMAVWLGVHRSVDLPHFVDCACYIIARHNGNDLSATQQNRIVGALLEVSEESIRQWRRGISHPSRDRMFDLIVRASCVIGGEYELLCEIYGPDRASELWRAP